MIFQWSNFASRQMARAKGRLRSTAKWPRTANCTWWLLKTTMPFPRCSVMFSVTRVVSDEDWHMRLLLTCAAGLFALAASAASPKSEVADAAMHGDKGAVQALLRQK